MNSRPVAMVGRKRVPGGIMLMMKCRDCGQDLAIFVSDKDDLTGAYPLECPCGMEVNLHFGDQALGRRLLEVLKEHQDDDNFRIAGNPSEN